MRSMHSRSIVVLDPGHGGSAPAGGSSPNRATGPGGLKEKDVALDVARKVRDLLDHVADVHLTRDTDRNLPLADRARLAKDSSASVFVSLHFNGSPDTSVDGTGTWTSKSASAGSKKLAEAIASRVSNALGTKNLGAREMNLGVLLPERHQPSTSACLAEIAYLTNAQREASLRTMETQQSLAHALAEAIHGALATPRTLAAAAAASSTRGTFDNSATHILEGRLTNSTVTGPSIRQKAIEILRAMEDLGIRNDPPGRRDAYIDAIIWGEPQKTVSKVRASFSHCNPDANGMCNLSSCGLVIRSLLRLLGASDPLLDPPYKFGSAISAVIDFARKHKAVIDVRKPADVTAANLEPGDIVYINNFAKGGHRQHIFMITARDGVTFHSIDGGSPNQGDGRCCGIKASTRTLPPNSMNFTTEPERPITQIIKLDRIHFTEPVIELIRKQSGQAPGVVTTALDTKPDFETAKNVMWEIIRIVNRQKSAKDSDPDQSSVKDAWFVQNKAVLREWYQLTFGDSKSMLKGEALFTKLTSAMKLTQPLIDVLEAKGGKEWKKQLGSFLYSKVADIEYLAAETAPKPPNPFKPKAPEFGKIPTPVTLDQCFSYAAIWPAEPVLISRGEGGFSLGTANVGATFSASNQDHRVLVWCRGGALMFMRDGVIYSQSVQSFSEDIIMGAFVIGAQNAVGSAIMAQLMVEISLSFTPWGAVADGVFALKALTEHDWKGAALQMLPGGLGLLGKVRPVRSAMRAAANVTRAAAAISARLAKGAVRFIGRGAYRLKDKLLRGIWVIGEGGAAAEKNTFRFYDEVADVWHEVPHTEGTQYFKCSTCKFTPRGNAEAVKAAADEIAQDLLKSPAYASRGKLLVNRKLIEDVVEAYGSWGDHVVELINNTWSSAPNAAKLFDETLQIAKDLSGIKGAVDIFEDLASSSVNTARGTIYELRWATAHLKELEALGIPVVKKNWIGKGLDVLKKSGEAVELKNFNFTSELYKIVPERSVERVLKQVKSRMKYKGVNKVTVVFSSEAGKMPTEFAKLLTDGMVALEKANKLKPGTLTFAFWP